MVRRSRTKGVRCKPRCACANQALTTRSPGAPGGNPGGAPHHIKSPAKDQTPFKANKPMIRRLAAVVRVTLMVVVRLVQLWHVLPPDVREIFTRLVSRN